MRTTSPRRIGQEHTAWDDPQTPPELLERFLHNVSEKNPKTGVYELSPKEPRVLTNPNMPLATLIYWAWRYPQHVEANPVLDLFDLEDKSLEGKAGELRQAIDKGWLNLAGLELPEADRYRLNIRFARAVLPLYEAISDNLDMRNALSEALQYLRGGYDITAGEIKRELYQLEGKANAILDDIRTTSRDEAAAWALMAAARVFERRYIPEDSCAAAAAHAQAYAAGMHDITAIGDKKFQRTQQDTDDFYSEARAVQAEMVREVYYAAQRHAVRQAGFDAMTKQAAENAVKAIEAEKGRIAKKAEIEKAVKQAKSASLKIQAVMAAEGAAETWPAWLGVGILAAGCVVVLVVGPEAVAAAGVAGAARLLIGIAEAVGVRTVSLAAVEGSELAALTAKLTKAGFVVTKAAVEVVAKVVTR